MVDYKVVQCPFCGFIQLSTAKSVFKCLRCSRTRRITTSKGIPSIRIIRVFADFKRANAFIQEYKRLQGFS
ncbi:hypothetical protein KY318_03870 [Candidatus Woesearchaeota archaeon]|nr:hypothetical protein [Candidatus Woesearchaeota archaeon]